MHLPIGFVPYCSGLTLPFLEQGQGITRRRQKFAREWDTHLKRSCAVQAEWLGKHPDSTVLILGAGRLVDCDLPFLLGNNTEVFLVDADPGCEALYQRLKRAHQRQLNFEISDITGLLATWTATLKKRMGWEETLETLRSLAGSGVSQLQLLTQGELALSLNILSQIPIIWRDYVERLLMNRFGKKFVLENDAAWLEAFAPCGRYLIEKHLADLENASYQSLLVITDVEYATYSGEMATGESPITWTRTQGGADSKLIVGEWKEGPELRDAEVSPSLFGVDLEDRAVLKRLFPNYEATLEDSWLWHIEPLGGERKGHGVVHRVSAISLDLSPSV